MDFKLLLCLGVFFTFASAAARCGRCGGGGPKVECPGSFIDAVGDVKGNGLGRFPVGSIAECSQRCLQEPACNSFNYSPTQSHCVMYKETKPTAPKWRDFHFCVKNTTGCGCDVEFTSISLSLNIAFTIISGQDLNGFPCYKGSDGSFLYVGSQGYWVVGPKLGVSTTISMKCPIKATVNIPTISWMFFQSGSWIHISDLFVRPQKSPSGGDTVCPEVYSPVCGEDGKTYGNDCKAGAVQIACDGVCPCRGGTVSGCSCSDETEETHKGKAGRCLTKYKGKYFCYVNGGAGSKCPDKQESIRAAKWWSYQACDTYEAPPIVG